MALKVWKAWKVLKVWIDEMMIEGDWCEGRKMGLPDVAA